MLSATLKILTIISCWVTLASTNGVISRPPAFQGTEPTCADNGCKQSGSINKAHCASACTSGVLISKSLPYGQSGACNCLEGDCKSVTGAVCHTKMDFSVTVTANGAFVFCKDGYPWATAGNAAAITLETEDLDCSKGVGVSTTGDADLYIQCGAACAGTLNCGNSDWIVTCHVECDSCATLNYLCN